VLDRHTALGRRDYANLLRLSGDYRVVELEVCEGDWVAGRPLQELQLKREGLLVLGIARADGSYDGAPGGAAKAEAGDTLMLYGREEGIRNLDERRSGVGGQLQHLESVARQKAEAEAEAQAEGADAAESARDGDAAGG
jgi:uncharacterized protein with PhoU and TrkA domain